MMSVSHYFLLMNIDNGDGGQPAVVELDHPLEPGQWYHLAVTFTARSAVQIFRQGVKSVFSGFLSRGSDRPENGSDAFKGSDPLQIHVNGRLVYEGQQVYPRYVFNQALGRSYVGFNFDGQIGPVRILSTPMSCEGILAMARFQIKDAKHSVFLEDGAIDKKTGGVKRKTVVSIHPQSHLGSLLVDEKSLDRYASPMPYTLAWRLGNARHALESAGGSTLTLNPNS
jgi:hypothetical protein